MKKKSYVIKGIDCASCALKLEDKLSKMDGVYSCTLSFMTSKLNILYDEHVLIEEKIESVILKTLFNVKIMSKTDLVVTQDDLKFANKKQDKVKRILFGKKKR